MGKKVWEEMMKQNEVWCCGLYAIICSPDAQACFKICKTITFLKPTQKSCFIHNAHTVRAVLQALQQTGMSDHRKTNIQHLCIQLIVCSGVSCKHGIKRATIQFTLLIYVKNSSRRKSKDVVHLMMITFMV